MRFSAEATTQVNLALADLQKRLGLKDTSTIKVTAVEAVEWSNAGLGCPKAGMMYAEVITPGFRILLEAASKTYEYHSNRKTKVVLCQGGRPVE